MSNGRPPYAGELSADIRQLHSSSYRGPEQLQTGPVLVVGMGNSGSEIALELSRTHPTSIAGQPGGELPVRHGRAAALFVLPIVRFVVAVTIVLLMTIPTAFLIIYMEMKIIALMNLRIGPDRVGPYGSLLSVVHGLKVLM